MYVDQVLIALFPGTVVNCFWKAGISKETQTASIEDMDDPFKLLAENLKEPLLRGLVEEQFDMDHYIDVDFDVSVTELSSLTGK